MNPIIKFRIWDKRIKRWWCEDSQYLQMDGKKIHPAPWSTLSCDLPNDNIIVQQYTGLKDKNGKEIYEGDIVKVYEYLNGKIWDGHLHYSVVEFDNGRFDINPAWCHQSLQNNTVEILGNIFENSLCSGCGKFGADSSGYCGYCIGDLE